VSVIVPRRLRAPAEDGAVLADPPLEEAGPIISANRNRFGNLEISLLGRPLRELRSEGRRSALAAAVAYLREAHEPPPVRLDSSLIMAGHQPELFHPGVWAKNFALNGLASHYDATPLNLIVDNDTAKSPVLPTPGPVDERAENGSWIALELPFDARTPDVAYEERLVQDEGLFCSLPERAAPVIQTWGFSTLLPAFWKEALRQAARTALLGERFAGARRVFERSWGCHNLEVPLSHLCRTDAFAWYAAHLICNFERFHSIHNEMLREHRRVNGVRSHSHPVPDLASEGEWLEAPFWIWRRENPIRSRLMARRHGDQIEVRSTLEPGLGLPSLSGRDGKAAAAWWRDFEARGIKLRSRALTTTLFARLVLADLFVHGIGGAKYDELNDQIIRNFYGLEPPRYLVLSGTLLLPFRLPNLREDDVRRLAHAIRDARWNPQRHLADGAASDTRAKQLAAEKQAWINLHPDDAPRRRARFHRLKSLTEELGAFTQDQEQSLQRQLSEHEKHLKWKAHLARRDYPFCLYPESRIRRFCTQFLHVRST
jgi:hypothetical protein